MNLSGQDVTCLNIVQDQILVVSDLIRATLAGIRSLWYIILATAGQNKVTRPEFGHSGQNTVLFASSQKRKFFRNLHTLTRIIYAEEYLGVFCSYCERFTLDECTTALQ